MSPLGSALVLELMLLLKGLFRLVNSSFKRLDGGIDGLRRDLRLKMGWVIEDGKELEE
jgi:hypothetical protein